MQHVRKPRWTARAAIAVGWFLLTLFGAAVAVAALVAITGGT